MIRYPIDPDVFYVQEGKRGRVRVNRRQIDNSPNVIEFQPFILQSSFEKGGEWEVQMVYEFWVENGYRRVGANNVDEEDEEQLA